MSRSVTTFALTALALTSLAGSTLAQSGKKPENPKPMPAMVHPEQAATKDAKRVEHAQREAIKEQEKDRDKAIKEQDKDRDKAIKEQDKDRSKAIKEQEKDREKAMKEQSKVVKRADHRADRETKRAFGMAVSEQAHLAKGLKLSPEVRRQWKAVDRKYDDQYRALRRDIRAAEKDGRPMDPAWTQRITVLRDQERAELRALLAPAQQVVFDRNVSRR